MASCLIGFVILFYGNSQAAIGANPSTFGQAGVTKFPHGVAIHAIQMLPLFCWLMAKIGVCLQRRTRITGFLIAATTTFLMFSLVQTLSGNVAIRPGFQRRTSVDSGFLVFGYGGW